MSLPVITVASGGVPVVDVTAGTKLGTPVTESTIAKGGIEVTKVTGGKPGLPVVYVTIPPSP